MKLIRLRRYNCACATKTVLLTPNSRTTISIAAILKGYKAFAQAVGQQAKEIDGKVCKDKKKGTGDNDNEKALGLEGRWSCQNPKDGGNTATDYDTFSKRFGKLDGHDTHVKSDDATKTPTGWPGTTSACTETADGMASDLSTLQRPEKAKVAGLLSKTVSGAEVVEIRAVSTTSVMLNACYEL